MSVPDDGYYDVGLRYSGGSSAQVRLNGSDLTNLALPSTSGWNTTTTAVFLPAGISRIELATNDAVSLDHLDVTPTTGAGNTLRFNNVTVPATGSYRMVVRYANAEQWTGHPYNDDYVDRGADISADTITFGNSSSGYAPDIDLIRIAAAMGGTSTPPAGGLSGFGLSR